METTEAEKKHLNDLVNNCIHFASIHGKVLDKHINPISKSLIMECADYGLRIDFSFFASGFSNGSCYIKVSKNGSVVLDAKGNYTAYAFGMEAKTYVKGEWEDKIPKWEH